MCGETYRGRIPHSIVTDDIPLFLCECGRETSTEGETCRWCIKEEAKEKLALERERERVASIEREKAEKAKRDEQLANINAEMKKTKAKIMARIKEERERREAEEHKKEIERQKRGKQLELELSNPPAGHPLHVPEPEMGDTWHETIENVEQHQLKAFEVAMKKWPPYGIPPTA